MALGIWVWALGFWYPVLVSDHYHVVFTLQKRLQKIRIGFSMKKQLFIFFTFFTLTLSFHVNAEHVMYVVTGTSNTLKIIDTDTDKITGEIGELENAHGLSGNANTEYLVAGSMNQDNMGKSLSKPVAITEEEHKEHHAADSGSSKSSGKSYVSIIHPKHGHVMRRIEVKGITHHTSVSPDGKVAIAVHSKNGGVSVINLDQAKVLSFIKTGQVPNYAVFSSDGQFLYVSNAGSGNVSVIDTHKRAVIKNIKVGLGPEHLQIDAHNEVLYVVNVIGGSVSAVNLADTHNIHTYKVGKSPHGISLSTDGKRLFVSNKGGNSLTRINISNDNIETISLEPAPYHVEVIPNSQKLYVSSRKQPKIWVIDQINMSVLKEINIGSGVAHQMVVLDR